MQRTPKRFKVQKRKLEEPTDYYTILGVSKDATSAEIKDSYFKLARVYHPDVNQEADARYKFDQILKAYEVLSDETKRYEYDGKSKKSFAERLREKLNINEDHITKQAENSIIEEFNNIHTKFRNYYDINNPKLLITHKGADINIVVGIDFNEALKGCFRQAEVLRFIVCSSCKGLKGKPGEGNSICIFCNGHGKIDFEKSDIKLYEMECPLCQGKGKYNEEYCKVCSNVGIEIKNSIESINIPALTISGHQATNGLSGDLTALVYVHPHEKFTLKKYKDDKFIIYSEETITLTQAILGATLNIETYYGTQQLIIPGGTNSGDELIIEPPTFGRGKLFDPKMSLDDYFKFIRSNSVNESSSVFQKSGQKVSPVSVVKINVDLPKTLNDFQLKIIHDYQQIEY